MKDAVEVGEGVVGGEGVCLCVCRGVVRGGGGERDVCGGVRVVVRREW